MSHSAVPQGDLAVLVQINDEDRNELLDFRGDPTGKAHTDCHRKNGRRGRRRPAPAFAAFGDAFPLVRLAFVTTQGVVI